MEGKKGASTYGATLHRSWTWRVAGSFSCLGQMARLLMVEVPLSVMLMSQPSLVPGKLLLCGQLCCTSDIGCFHNNGSFLLVSTFHQGPGVIHVGGVLTGWFVRWGRLAVVMYGKVGEVRN